MCDNQLWSALYTYNTLLCISLHFRDLFLNDYLNPYAQYYNSAFWQSLMFTSAESKVHILPLAR